MNGFSLIGRELDFGFWILDWIEFPEFFILELLIPHVVVPFFFFFFYALLWLALVLAVSTFIFSM